MFRSDAASTKAIPTTVFHRIVSFNTITAIIGAIAGLRKNANAPVEASANSIALK